MPDESTQQPSSPPPVGSARALIVTPDGVEHEIYFRCAKCGRPFIWTVDDGHCPKCYHDSFKIVGFRDAPKKRCYFPWCGVDGKLCVDCAQAS